MINISTEASFDIIDESEDPLRLETSKINLSHSDNSFQESLAKTDLGDESIPQTPEVKKDSDLKLLRNTDKIDRDEHPKQIQQWLQQILVETETEPVIHEIEQFAEISRSRYRQLDFSLKT